MRPSEAMASFDPAWAARHGTMAQGHPGKGDR